MGKWFAAFLKSYGYQVIIFDRNQSASRALARRKGYKFARSLEPAIQSARLVLFATPTQVTKLILEHISPSILAEKLVVEISSVKQPLSAVIRKLRRRNVKVLSIHPMFGPGATTLRGKTVLAAFVPSGNRLARAFLSILRDRGARIVKADFAEHDRLISALLALPHFANIVLINALKAVNFDPDLLHEVGGTTIKLQSLIAEAIYQEDLDNEASILMDSKQALKSLEAFARQSATTLNLIRKGKRRKLITSLGKGREFLKRDKYFSTAYSRFNAALEASAFQ